MLRIELSSREIEVVRADELRVDANWQASILSAIKKADLLIAIMDSQKANGNVMLEIGYAIGAGRQVMLLCENPSEIPFDLSSIPAFVIRDFGPWAIEEIVHWIKASASKNKIERRIFESAREQLHQAMDDPEFLEQISPGDFERLIGEMLSEMGFDTVILYGRHESGFDIILNLPSGETAVVVKKYTAQGRLGIGDVQRLIGSCVVASMRTGLMITNTGYTTSATELAMHSPVPIQLMTLRELLSESKDSLTRRCTSRNGT
ncbi:restriction endonuclease [Singulisphaera sp. PoT]|uniref:restriction endonuclease n=1 Tax=Singulisphaera sp. PoT TaxID=3411797 RepID=UPI003BF5CA13